MSKWIRERSQLDAAGRFTWCVCVCGAVWNTARPACSDSFASRAVSTVPTLGTVHTRYSGLRGGRPRNRGLILFPFHVVQPGALCGGDNEFWNSRCYASPRGAMPHLPICLYGVVLNQLSLLHLGKGFWGGGVTVSIVDSVIVVVDMLHFRWTWRYRHFWSWLLWLKKRLVGICILTVWDWTDRWRDQSAADRGDEFGMWRLVLDVVFVNLGKSSGFFTYHQV